MATHDLKGAVKAIKVKLKSSSDPSGPRLSNDIIVSGVNIFGYLSEMYKDGNLPKMGDFGGGQQRSAFDLVDQQFAVHLKKIQKKDKVTKSKGLGDLRLVVQKKDLGDQLKSCFAFYLYHFCRIVILESSKTVREAAFGVLLQFIRKDKKLLRFHMHKLFPFWYISIYDPAKSVGMLASQCFDEAFPTSHKRQKLFAFVYKNFVDFLKTHLNMTQTSLTQDIVGNISKNEEDAIYDRVVGSSLQALANSFSFVTGSAPWADLYSNFLRDELQIQSQGNKHFLCAFLTKQSGDIEYRTPVRSAALNVVSAFLTHQPSLLKPGLPSLGKLIWGLLEEKSNTIQNELWNGGVLFKLTQSFQHQIWDYINIRQEVIPKLKFCLKRAAFGSATSLYRNFIKIVSILPCFYFDQEQVRNNLRKSSLDSAPPPSVQETSKSKKNKFQLKEKIKLLNQVMQHLLSGLHNDESVLYAGDLIHSYYDSLTFVMVKRVLCGESFNTDVYNELQKPLRLLSSLPIRELFRTSSTLQKIQIKQISSTIAQGLSNLLVHFDSKNIPEDFAAPLLFQIQDLCLGGLKQATESQVKHGFVLRLLKSFLALVPPENKFHGFVIRLFNSSITLMLDIIKKGLQTKNDKKSILNIAIMLVIAEKLIYKASNENHIKLIADLDVVDKLISIIELPLLVATAGEDPVRRCVSMLSLISSAKLVSQVPINLPLLKISHQGIGSKVQVKSILSSKFHPFSAVISCRKKKDLQGKKSQTMMKISQKLTPFLLHLQESNEYQEALISLLSGLATQTDYFITFTGEIIKNVIGFHLDTPVSHITNQTLQALLSKGYKVIETRENALASVSLLKAFERIIIETDKSDSVINLLSNAKEITQAIRNQLFELIVVSDRHGVELWQLYWRIVKTSKNKEYLEKTVQILQNQLANLVVMENHQVVLFDKFISATQNLISQLDTPQEKRSILVSLVLENPSNFTGLEKNCLPLKIVQKLLLSGGGIGFSVSELITNPKYTWFIGHLLASKFLPSLLGYDDLRRQLMLYCETEIIPFIIGQLMEYKQEYWDIFKDLLAFLLDKSVNQQQICYTQALVAFIHSLIEPNSDYFQSTPLTVESIEHIWQIILESAGDKSNFSKSLLMGQVQAILHPKLLKQSESYKQSILFSIDVQSLQIENLLDCKTLDSLVLSEKQLTQEETEYIYELVKQLSNLQPVNIQAMPGVLRFIKSNPVPGLKQELLLLVSLNILKSFENLALSDSALLLTMKSCLVLIRFFLADLSEYSDQKFSQIVNEILSLAVRHTQNYVRKLKILTQIIDQKSLAEPAPFVSGELELLNEIGETISRLASFHFPSVNQNALYQLLQSRFIPVQKAAYHLLKAFYETTVPLLEYPVAANDQEQLKAFVAQIEHKFGENLDQEQKEALPEVLSQMKLPPRLFLNKNVPLSAINAMQIPPALDTEDVMPTEGDSLKYLTEREEEMTMTAEQLGFLLVWNSILIKLSNGFALTRAREQTPEVKEYSRLLQNIQEYIEENQTASQLLLFYLGPFLPMAQKRRELRHLSEKEIIGFNPEWMDLSSQKAIHNLSLQTLLRFANLFPELLKRFYSTNLTKEQYSSLSLLLTEVISPALLAIEINKLQLTQFEWKKEGLNISIIKNTREIRAHYTKQEVEANLLLKIPKDYPLKSIEVKLENEVKVKEPTVRKWLLQISKILNHENGDILDAILKWKQNLSSAFEGVDECPICYYIVHPSTRSLPHLPCRTCKNKFHGECIRKWFRQSQKSKCPFCQNYFWS